MSALPPDRPCEKAACVEQEAVPDSRRYLDLASEAAVERLAGALAITGHDVRRRTLGTDLAEHDHEGCLFKEPMAEDARTLLAALRDKP